MSVRILAASLLAVAVVSVAQAGPTIGTAKARGDYRSFSQSQSSGGHARSSYRYQAPAFRSAPAIVQAPRATVAPAPQVAQAPVEARRFSYSPSAAPAASPCQAGTTSVTDSGRRYSYDPGAIAAPVESSPRAYTSRPSYSGGSRSGGHVDRWALPKTDPRKYNSR